MFDKAKLVELEKEQENWKTGCLQKTPDKIKMKAEHFPKQFCSPLDIRDFDHDRDLGFPEDYPFTMATHPTSIPAEFLVGARARYSGFGTPEDTRDHFKFLVSKGFTGPSIALDLPTQIGYDSDHPLAVGEVGKIGVAFDPTVEERQLANLAAVKKERDDQKVQAALDQIRRAAEGTENLMVPVIEAVKVQTTIGEICQVLREVSGEYQPYTHL